jgi:hypothetical protein
MQRRRFWFRWLFTAATALLLLLYYLSVPFYSGSSLGPHGSWRFEHGRIKLQYSPSTFHESFYIANNSEGLRFAPQLRASALNDWFINLPLWVPFALTTTAAVLLWRSRYPRGHCHRCGYDRKGLPGATPCPECGRPPRT